MAVVQGKIRVSFDLDEVLFVNPSNHKTEPPLRAPFRFFYKERLRLGTVRLIPALKQMGCEVWVYTTSYRTEKYIKSLFRCYHVRFDGIVNGQRHEKEVQGNKKEIMPTKLPNHYGITLHIDDESIVATYGRTYGFEVYQLDAQDDEWEAKIIDRVRRIREKQNAIGNYPGNA